MTEENFTGWDKHLSNQDYHEKKSIGSTVLKAMQTSPKHFKCAWDGQVEVSAQKQTAFNIGTCFHQVILEQNTDRFVKGPEVSSKNTKVWQEAKAKATADGKILLTPGEHARVLEGFEAFCEHPKAHKLVSSCQKIEESGFYKDPETRLACKFRPDGYCMDDQRGDFIFDYKTTSNLDIYSIEKAIHSYGYYISAAHYIEGVRALEKGRDVQEFYFCFQEKERPFDVVIFLLDQESLKRGIELRQELLKKVFWSIEKNEWPGVSGDVRKIGLPKWALQEA